MGFFHEEEANRFLNHLAMQAYPSFSELEGSFVYEGKKIPIYTNLCLACALCASRQIENAEKAKVLIKKLLCFQSKEGGFPRYLHDYPSAVYDYLQLDIHQLLFEIISKHQQTIGKELLEKCIQAKDKLWQAIKTWMEKDLVDQRTLLKYEISAFIENEQKIPTLPKLSFTSSKILGELLLGLRLTPHYKEWVERLKDMWHPNLCCYCGPAIDEIYEKARPSITLLDYSMAFYHKTFSSRLKEPSLLQFQGALTPVCQNIELTNPSSFSGEYKKNRFSVINNEESSFFYFENYNPEWIDGGRGFHLLRYAWKEGDETLSLVCSSSLHQVEKNADGFLFTLNQEYPEEVSSQDEIEFYISKHHSMKWYVNGYKGALFRENDALEVKTHSVRFELSFNALEASGEFLGHVSFGSRPSEAVNKNSKIYEAHDLKIVLRTLRRTKGCRIEVKLKMEPLAQENHTKLPLHEDHYQHKESHL